MGLHVFLVFFSLGVLLSLTNGQIRRCSLNCNSPTNGFCTFAPNGTEYCLCRPTHMGPNCQYTNPCLPDPCENAAPCTPLQQGADFRCDCLSGYTGKTCNAFVDMCVSNPCDRGACQTNGTDFVCRCPGGWGGRTCADYVGYCYTSPCNRVDASAKCENDPPGYTCQCSSGDFFGLNCEGRTQGCVEQEDSYCVCSVDNLPVKFPFPAPDQYRGIRTQDAIDALIGMGIGYLVGSIFFWIYHYYCRRPRPALYIDQGRPATGTSMVTSTSGLSKVSPIIDIQPKADAPQNMNVYRASFNDDLSHNVANRKSLSTYNTSNRDW